MFPGMNPRDVQKAMKRLGIRQEEIDAEIVIIKTADKDIIIKNPQVSRVNMGGQETFQIAGDIEESGRSGKVEINDDDVATVVGQTNCTREEALDALEESNGNLAEAILKLQNK
ncbi:MAG: nascent polypeptide-associated complex protein [Nanoarchaeota archaeon]